MMMKGMTCNLFFMLSIPFSALLAPPACMAHMLG